MKRRHSGQTSRRAFLGTVALAAGGLNRLGRSINAAEAGSAAKRGEPTRELRFTQPFAGGVIHEECGPPVVGVQTGPDGKKQLKVEVAGSVPPGAKLELFAGDGQRIPVTIDNGVFRGTALLRDRITEIKARTTINGEPREIRTRAVWAKNSYRRFRCYIDDHSFFFRDICAKN